MRNYVILILFAFVTLLFTPISFAEGQSESRSITIAYSGAPETNIYNALIENFGYFTKNHLKVTPSYYPTSKEAAELVISGDKDFGVVNSYTVARMLNEGKNPVILTSVLRIDEIYYITVNQKTGITSPGDLKGKRIGLVPDDSWEYFLDKFLTLNGGDISTVTLVPLPNQKNVIEKLTVGEIDAGLTLYQDASGLTANESDTYQMWSVNNFENNYILLISNKDFITKNPEVVKNVIKAFVESWDTFNSDPGRVKQEIGKKSGLTEKQMDELVSGLTPEVTLTQGLLNIMETQSRYLLNSGTGTITETPDYLNVIDFTFLDAVSPMGDTIIHG
ncbi:MAG TPA: ABC transporter substrate-binding protein [Methanospirillum sp.]|nr:ABC transporter substrate-binding protein [Methanospirillum sp.]